MLDTVLAKVFGTQNARDLKRVQPLVAETNAREAGMRALSDTDLRRKTGEFRQRLDQGASMDDLLVDAFAVVRESGRRVLEMRHFDVQLIGGIMLHRGKIAEMKTGEGKTLVATLAAYLNALEGQGVHVVTVNDYLAPARCRLDGADLPFPGDECRRHPARHPRRGAPRGLSVRHHLRHEQRVRLRLPARQHEVRGHAVRPTHASLRHRRRGRQHPDR